MDELLWQPSEAVIAGANITKFRTQVARDWQVNLHDTAALWQWSVDEIENFWLSLWRYCDVIADGPHQPTQEGADLMPRGAAGGTQHGGDRSALAVEDDDRLEAVFVVVRVEEPQLLLAVHGKRAVRAEVER